MTEGYYVIYSHLINCFIVNSMKPKPEDKDHELISWYEDFDVACEEARKKNEGK